ncbi:TolC family protein [Puia sp. P3]|uniref:TolC family protein n=1 Tax=Puia sp. P3 TaxID=3423952 RepID=UPI003D676FE4
MKTLIFLLSAIPLLLRAQTPEIQLGECQQKAVKHVPIIKEKELLQRIETDRIKNANTARLPQNEFAAQATYQSAVPTLPIKIPGVSVTPVDKDQFRVTDETSVLIYDAGRTTAQKALVRALSLVEQQKVEVDLYSIRSEVTRLFANIVESDTRLELLQLLKQNVEDRIVKVNAGVEAGTVLASNLLVLQAEDLGITQRIDEQRSNRKGLIDIMNVYTGDALDTSTRFIMPAPDTGLKDSITRPEISLFNYQSTAYSVQRRLLDANTRPQFKAFFQGGVGRPGLNILDNDIKGFYVTGIKMSWTLGSFYTLKRDKDVLHRQQEIVDAQKQTFQLRVNAQLAGQKEEIAKLSHLLQQDIDIISVRTKVKDISSGQLDAGVITSSDYLIELNAQNQALTNQKLHQVQLVFAYIQYNLIAG